MSESPTPWVFMGSDAIAIPVLESLYGNKLLTLKAIFTQPDKPHGRGKKLQENAIKTWAITHKIPVFQPENLRNENREWIIEEDINWVLVMAYGQYIPRKFLETPKLGIYNLHSSLLPAYRGASPIETAIAVGDTLTGTSLMKVIPEMDAGPLLDKEDVVIDKVDTGSTLRKKIAASCIPLMDRNLEAILSGQAVLQEQDPQKVTYVRKLIKEDGWLDFSLPATLLEARTRAFASWPGTFCEYEGTRLKTGKCSVEETLKKEPPGIVVAHNERGLSVACKEGALVIHELQRPGGKMLNTKEFLRGFPIPEGSLLEGRAALPLVSKTPFGRDFPART